MEIHQARAEQLGDAAGIGASDAFPGPEIPQTSFMNLIL